MDLPLIYLHKLLPLIVSPLGLVMFLIGLGVLLKQRIYAFLGLIVFIVASLPITGIWIWQQLESAHPYQTVESAPSADAIVVLSNEFFFNKRGESFVTEWSDPDRFFTGIELYKAGKAKYIIFTKVQMPWSDYPAIGSDVVNKAIQMGIPRERVLLSDEVANTEDEAIQVKKVLARYQLNDILLVTSSFHLPRSTRIFTHYGIDNYPFPADFKARTEVIWNDYIPSSKGFDMVSDGIREYIGRLFYALKFA